MLHAVRKIADSKLRVTTSSWNISESTTVRASKASQSVNVNPSEEFKDVLIQWAYCALFDVCVYMCASCVCLCFTA